MKRRTACGLASLLAASQLMAQSMTEAAARERQRRESVRAAEWQEFQNPGGDFKVLFPYAPLKKREHIPGLPTLMDTFMAAKEKRFYAVRVGELPSQLANRPGEQTQDELRAGILKDVLEGRIEAESKVSLGGRAGREYRVRAKARTGEEVLLVVRTFVTGNRILLVLAGGLADDKDTAIAERFFSSFAILR